MTVAGKQDLSGLRKCSGEGQFLSLFHTLQPATGCEEGYMKSAGGRVRGQGRQSGPVSNWRKVRQRHRLLRGHRRVFTAQRGKKRRLSEGQTGFFRKANGLVGAQKGNETGCDNICSCRCTWSCCLFHGHGIPLGKDLRPLVSDKGISEKVSFCICGISNDFS